MNRPSKLVTCTSCGWVHVLLEREDAQKSVDAFNSYTKTLDRQRYLEFYNGLEASIAEYERCFGCGSTKPMRWHTPGDCPDGVTVQGTILKPE